MDHRKRTGEYEGSALSSDVEGGHEERRRPVDVRFLCHASPKLVCMVRPSGGASITNAISDYQLTDQSFVILLSPEFVMWVRRVKNRECSWFGLFIYLFR